MTEEEHLKTQTQQENHPRPASYLRRLPPSLFQIGRAAEESPTEFDDWGSGSRRVLPRNEGSPGANVSRSTISIPEYYSEASLTPLSSSSSPAGAIRGARGNTHPKEMRRHSTRATTLSAVTQALAIVGADDDPFSSSWMESDAAFSYESLFCDMSCLEDKEPSHSSVQ